MGMLWMWSYSACASSVHPISIAFPHQIKNVTLTKCVAHTAGWEYWYCRRKVNLLKWIGFVDSSSKEGSLKRTTKTFFNLSQVADCKLQLPKWLLLSYFYCKTLGRSLRFGVWVMFLRLKTWLAYTCHVIRNPVTSYQALRGGFCEHLYRLSRLCIFLTKSTDFLENDLIYGF